MVVQKADEERLAGEIAAEDKAAAQVEDDCHHGAFATTKVQEGTVQIGKHQALITAESGVDINRVTEAKAFKDWIGLIRNEEHIEVSKVHMQSMDMSDSNVDIVKFTADFAKDSNDPRKANVVLRGGGATVLIVLKHEHKRYTLVARQPRVPVCESSLPEIPAGKLDSDGNLAGGTSNQMKKATGIEINETELVCLTQLAYGDKYPGMYPTCRGSDEHNQIYLKRQLISAQELAHFEKSIADMNEECKSIQFQICPLEKLWRMSPDANALSALCLHDKLVAAGRIPEF